MGKSACAGETLADLGSTLWAKAVITSSFERERNGSCLVVIGMCLCLPSGPSSPESHYCS